MKECKSGIYKVTNLVNDKIYIGQSVDIFTRFYHHKYELNNNSHSNQYLQREWNKYGENVFMFEIVEECLESELNNRETVWIINYNSNNRQFGYNLKEGGANGRHSPETLLKMSNNNAMKNNPEVRYKVSKARKLKYSGKNHPNYGKTMSLEQRNKLSIIHKEKYSGINHPNYGKKLSEETKNKISETRLGKKHSLETKQKMSESRKKDNHFNFIERTPEMINDINEMNYKEYSFKYNVSISTYYRIKNEILS